MLRDKSVENLAAGELLFERGHVNAATSRFYYAMYQAAVSGLDRAGYVAGRIRSGALEWDHSMVENNIAVCRTSREDRLLFMRMRKLRTRADYRDDAVLSGELEDEVGAVRRFVREVVR